MTRFCSPVGLADLNTRIQRIKLLAAYRLMALYFPDCRAGR